MYSSRFLLSVLVGGFLALNGFADDNLFATDGLGDTFSLTSDPTANLIALNDPSTDPIQGENMFSDTSTQSVQDSTNTALEDTSDVLPDSDLDTTGSLDPAIEPLQDGNSLFNAPSELNGDETDPNLYLAGCPTTDRLGARDGSSVCPTNHVEIPALELPTLDQFTGKLIPADEKSQGLTKKLRLPVEPNILDGPYLTDDGSCSPDKHFRLCCICDGSFEFAFCQDCLKSEFTFHSW